MSKKFTPWFLFDVKPARIGVYETDRGFQHWSGSFWGGWSQEVDSAHTNRYVRSSHQVPAWRGIAKKP